ncbi:MAG: hypothetical protein II786_06990 [Muribaculaceae bacterium]|nr:hypothetical protein [Muribaculaceae bacterium]
MDELMKILADEATPVNEQWVEQMQERFPYFPMPLLLYLKRNGVAGHEDMLARLAIAWPDRKSLSLQLGDGVDGFAQFYPSEPEPATPDTEVTIDRFLDHYGNASTKEIEALQAAIFHPMPDYADILAAQDRDEAGTTPAPSAVDDQEELINRFIAEQQDRDRAVISAPAQQHVEESERAEIADVEIVQPVETDDRMLSESLAKMYIQRHKYSQALEIIENISLKFPEKSIYFADQIRFLKKLVLIEEKKQQNN